MAERLDISSSNASIDSIKEYLESVKKLEELNSEINTLRKCELMKDLNEDTDMLIKGLLNTKSTLKYIMDTRVAITNRLKKPVIPNSLLLEYNMQENFLKCCYKMSHIVNYLIKSNQKTPKCLMELDDDNKLIALMEKEVKLQRLYLSHVKSFHSSVTVLEEHFKKLAKIMNNLEE